MKKILSIVAFATAALFALQSCDDDDKLVSYDDLPSVAKEFGANNFPTETITSTLKDYDTFGYTYQVTLSDGTAIEFDKDGDWIEIENRVSGVSTSVLPAKILDYITANYANSFVVDIEKDRGYDVELNTGLDLDFDSDGNFERIDA
jgi:hypothetical protein